MKKQFKVTILVSFISEVFNKERSQPFEGCYSGFCVCVLLDTVCHIIFSCYFGIFKGTFFTHSFYTFIPKTYFPGNPHILDSISTANVQKFNSLESCHICLHEPHGKVRILSFLTVILKFPVSICCTKPCS